MMVHGQNRAARVHCLGLAMTEIDDDRSFSIDVSLDRFAKLMDIKAFSQMDPMFLLNGSYAKPAWVPDAQSKTCQCGDCKTVFTNIVRRHHCRYCGLLVCGNCSQNRVSSKMFTKAVRCCTVCWSRLKLLTDSNLITRKLTMTTDWLREWQTLLQPRVFRIALFGEHKVGKSSVCHRLAYDSLNSCPAAGSHSGALTLWFSRECSGLPVIFELWDLPGDSKLAAELIGLPSTAAKISTESKDSSISDAVLPPLRSLSQTLRSDSLASDLVQRNGTRAESLADELTASVKQMALQATSASAASGIASASSDGGAGAGAAASGAASSGAASGAGSGSTDGATDAAFALPPIRGRQNSEVVSTGASIGESKQSGAGDAKDGKAGAEPAVPFGSMQAVLLCYDVNSLQSFLALPQWVQLARTVSPVPRARKKDAQEPVPLFLVGNKTDMCLESDLKQKREPDAVINTLREVSARKQQAMVVEHGLKSSFEVTATSQSDLLACIDALSGSTIERWLRETRSLLQELHKQCLEAK